MGREDWIDEISLSVKVSEMVIVVEGEIRMMLFTKRRNAPP